MSDETTHRCEGGCGRWVSGNKHRCLQCIEDEARATVQAKEEELLEQTTHVIMIHRSRDQEDLYRNDGMLVGSRQDDVVRFGHDIATAQSRMFRNKEDSKAWLRRLADIDIQAEANGKPLHEFVYGYASLPRAAVIEEKDIEAEVNLTVVGDLKSLRRN